MSLMEGAAKRPRTEDAFMGAMPPPAGLPEKSPRLAPVSDSATAGSSILMLQTVEDVMSALPGTPQFGPSLPGRDGRTPSPFDAAFGLPPAQPQRSPAYPSGFAAFNNGARLKPTLSTEPPLLDLGTCGVFESPALMPASALASIPALDMMPQQMARCVRQEYQSISSECILK